MGEKRKREQAGQEDGQYDSDCDQRMLAPDVLRRGRNRRHPAMLVVWTECSTSETAES
jgi:hypothetical protein